jgi:hypothetical protein
VSAKHGLERACIQMHIRSAREILLVDKLIPYPISEEYCMIFQPEILLVEEIEKGLIKIYKTKPHHCWMKIEPSFLVK